MIVHHARASLIKLTEKRPYLSPKTIVTCRRACPRHPRLCSISLFRLDADNLGGSPTVRLADLPAAGARTRCAPTRRWGVLNINIRRYQHVSEVHRICRTGRHPHNHSFGGVGSAPPETTPDDQPSGVDIGCGVVAE